MRILFFGFVASTLLILMFYELDHGLTRGRITVPEAPELKDVVPKPPTH